MKSLVAAIACACFAGCASTGDDLPVQPGGGGSGASGGGASTGGAVTGRVCLVNDPRILTTCSEDQAGGLVVALGASRAITEPNGAFSLPQPAGSNLSFTVSGSNIVTASQPFSPANNIPVMAQDLFGQVLAANGIVLTQGSGTILASVVDRGGNPVSGALATSTPSPAFGPFFDGTTPTAWTLNGTGERGVVMFPGVAIGPAALTFTDSGSTGESTVDGIQVIDGGITIVDAVLP